MEALAYTIGETCDTRFHFPGVRLWNRTGCSGPEKRGLRNDTNFCNDTEDIGRENPCRRGRER